MNLNNRSYKKELLDDENIPFADIQRNMEELNFINTYLGGHAITIAGLKKLVGDKKQIHVCEIGCGGGDNLLAILKWCNRKRIEISFTGIDIQPACIAFAKTRKALQNNTDWIISDYKMAIFKKQPDIIFSSLFCHHFTEVELVEQLRWMQQNSIVGFFINDLQRHWLAYRSIKLLTRIFSRSYLVKNDAPLSVARGFIKPEWINILKEANIRHISIEWKWAFRHLIVSQNL